MHCIGSDEEDSQMADTQVKVGHTWEVCLGGTAR